jgi:hypothetical protein
MQASDFYGNGTTWFTGVVKRVIDESYVQVRIFGVHPIENQTDVDDSDLPKALVLYPTTGGQAGSGAPTHNIQVDSWVVGIFADPKFKMQPIILGVVQGTDYSMSTQGSNGGKFVGNDDSGTGDIGNSNETINIPGGSNVEKTYNFVSDMLKKEGVTDTHLLASALVGCLMLETTNINPQTVNSIGATGICQWLGPRKKQLLAKYGKNYTLENQLSFMWWELNNTERAAKKKWLGATNMPDAVAGFCTFERNEMMQYNPMRVNRAHPNYKKCLKFAYGIYNTKGATS